MKLIKKIWSVLTTGIVMIVVMFAVLMLGTKLFGLQAFMVLSGSMEPTYHTGSLIFVKEVDPATLQVGDPLTFRLGADTIATHRIVELVTDQKDASITYFRTKGDANAAEDNTLIAYEDVVGKPLFTIPYLGYVIDYIQQPPGSYIAISVAALLIMVVFLPDLFAGDKNKKQQSEQLTLHDNAASDVENKEVLS